MMTTGNNSAAGNKSGKKKNKQSDANKPKAVAPTINSMVHIGIF